MNTKAFDIETLFDKVENYTKTSIDLVKLQTIERSADIVSSITARILIILIATMFILFLNIGLGLWIGELLGKTYLGFLSISGFYLLLSIVLFYFKNSLLKQPISNTILTKLLKNVDLTKIIHTN